MLGNYSTLQLAHLNDGFERQSKMRLKNHYAVCALVDKNQDERCSVTKEVALTLIKDIHKYALVMTIQGEMFGFSVVMCEGQKLLLYTCLNLKQDERGRYEVTAASDEYALLV